MRILLLSMSLVIAASSGNNGNLQSKSIINLGLMASQYIQCPFPYFPIPYGCWCGISIPFPPTHDPVDNFDQLCKTHDYCYEEAYVEGCDIVDAYIWDYDWKIENNEIICAEDQDFCQKYICNCDKDVIMALAKEADTVGCPDGNPGCPDDKTI